MNIVGTPYYILTPFQQMSWEERIARYVEGRKISNELKHTVQEMLSEIERKQEKTGGLLLEEEWKALTVLREYQRQIECHFS